MSMRTLLDGVKGDLWNLARRRPKENMTWSRMVSRLAKGRPGGAEHVSLLREDHARSQLISALSAVGKDREGSQDVGLVNLWNSMIDHIYVVLGLVRLRD